MASIGFRGVFTLFFDGMISAMNPYPKPWKFRVRRILQGWDGDVFLPQYARIDMTGNVSGTITDATNYPDTDRNIHAMNPAHIIYECLTNRVWGRGLPRNRIGPTFEVVAQTLHAEGFGLCIRWARQTQIDDFVKGIVDTIAASLYTNKATGKIEIKLIRGDYDFASLPVFDPSSGLLDVSEATVASPASQVTECIVTYHDPITDKDRKVRSQNLGVIQGTSGGANTISRTYQGVPTAELALRLAQRDLKGASSRLRRFNFTLDRRGWNINPGDVIRIRDPFRGIPDTAMRVGTVDDGTMSDGRIKIQALQDVFTLSATSFTGVEPDRWLPPSNNPCLGRHLSFEVPYFLLVSKLSPAELSAVSGSGGFVMSIVEEGKPLNNSFDLMLKNGAADSSENSIGSGYYCPTWDGPAPVETSSDLVSLLQFEALPAVDQVGANTVTAGLARNSGSSIDPSGAELIESPFAGSLAIDLTANSTVANEIGVIRVQFAGSSATAPLSNGITAEMFFIRTRTDPLFDGSPMMLVFSDSTGNPIYGVCLDMTPSNGDTSDNVRLGISHGALDAVPLYNETRLVFSDAPLYSDFSTVLNLPLNQAVHLALTVASDGVKLYAGGTAVEQESTSIALTSMRPSLFMSGLRVAYYAGTIASYGGQYAIDSVRVTRGVLYTANFTPPTAPLA